MQASKQSNIEGRVILAITALKKGQVLSIRAAARAYAVPYESLRIRYHGTPSRRDSRSVLRKLTSTEEEVLIQRILDLDIQGFPPRISVVREIANLIFANRKITPL